jgi:hypothetical protein
MAGREIFTGVTLAPEIIEEIKKMTGDCPNLYFGTPEYPIPAVACGRSCDIFDGQCKLMPQRVHVPEGVRRAEVIVKTRLQNPSLK